MKPKTIWLEYGKAGRKRKLLPNLSAVARAGKYLWTASDETRSIECLQPDGNGYRLRKQYKLDDWFPELPGLDEGDEGDIEALEVLDGRLWICGSHSLTRRAHQKQRSDRVDPTIHDRPSRCLLGSVRLSTSGDEIEGDAVAIPFEGDAGLREILLSNTYLKPFAALPSKENGLDIEGMAIHDGSLYLGLRGPVVDNIAIIVEIALHEALGGEISDFRLHLKGWESGIWPYTKATYSFLPGPSAARTDPLCSSAGSRGTP